MLLSEGRISDDKGAALLIDALPGAATLLGDSWDADWLCTALAQRGLDAGVPSKANRKAPIPHNAALLRRHEIEITFGRLKDWRRIHARCVRCAHAFMPSIGIAVTVIL